MPPIAAAIKSSGCGCITQQTVYKGSYLFYLISFFFLFRYVLVSSSANTNINQPLFGSALLGSARLSSVEICSSKRAMSLELFLDLRDLFLLPTKSIVIVHDTHRLVLLHCLHLCPIFNSDNLLRLYHFQNIIGGFDIELVMVIFRRSKGAVLEERFNPFVRVNSRRLYRLEKCRRPSTQLLDIISYSS